MAPGLGHESLRVENCHHNKSRNSQHKKQRCEFFMMPICLVRNSQVKYKVYTSNKSAMLPQSLAIAKSSTRVCGK